MILTYVCTYSLEIISPILKTVLNVLTKYCLVDNMLAILQAKEDVIAIAKEVASGARMIVDYTKKTAKQM